MHRTLYPAIRAARVSGCWAGELALSCDIVIAARSARFGALFISPEDIEEDRRRTLTARAASLNGERPRLTIGANYV
jgi:hypothetical protein